MSFLVYDLTFLVLFSVFIFIFLHKRRKNLKREGITYLYRTKLGIKFIDYVAKKYPKTLGFMRYIVVIFGYSAMFGMLYLLWKTIEIFVLRPDIIQAIKIPPLAPLIPYLPQIFKAEYLPMFYFTYWIIVLAVVAIVHEFSHGIFSRYAGIKIKSTGFAFIGPFLGAFVEPDEKQMEKKSKFNQLAMLASGTFANAVFTIVFFIILFLFFSIAFTASGALFNIYGFSYITKPEIKTIGASQIINMDGGMNVTEIKTSNSTYYMPTELLMNLSSYNETRQIFVFEDTPALKAGLQGAIISIDNQKTKTNADVKNILAKYNPGESVTIKTLNTDTKETKDYKIILAENPNNKSQAYVGVAGLPISTTSLLGKIRAKFSFFKDPYTYYAPRIASDLTLFIYYLFWWLAFINFSVALANMLPAWIFDGGRFFYLSVLAITKSEKFSKLAFKITTYIVLGAFLLLMVYWAFAIF